MSSHRLLQSFVSFPPHPLRKLSPLQNAGSESQPIRGTWSLPEVRIAVIYVIIASTWIIGSDKLLDAWTGELAHSVLLQTCKGLNFVLTTGLVLYFVLRRAYGGWRQAEEHRMAAVQAARECYRDLSVRTEALREEERTRISREIHDELGQLLTGIKMQLRLIENRLNNLDDRAVNPVIDDLVEASEMVDDMITAIRRISSGLRPLALDHLGLDAALAEEVDHFIKRTGLPCKLVVETMDEPIPAKVQTAAFRICQEALTNVARHARARRVEVRCATRGGMLTLTVLDDGSGFETRTVLGNPTSLGLIGMMERAADAGGNLQVHSSCGRGTEVVLAIPLQNPSSVMDPIGIAS